MHGHRVCCCNGADTAQCCADYPVWCFDGESCEGGCWHPLYRTGVYEGAEVTMSSTGLSLTLAYSGSTQAIDPVTNEAFCGFPDPQQYPYPVLTPSGTPFDIFPLNYSVPLFAVNDPTLGQCEVAWPIFNKDKELCWPAVLGFEARGSGLIQKLLGSWGASPNNLTGCANGTGQHWYTTAAGTLRYFADLGRWKSRNSGYGPPHQHPFHIQDVVHNSNPDVPTFSTQNWCKENGECLPLCRCNHSWPEHKHCCKDLECHFDLNYKDGCGETSVTCQATFRTDWYPTNCQTVSEIPRLNGGTHYPAFNPNLPGGTFSLTEAPIGLGCCTVDVANSTFNPPNVVGIRFGCNVRMRDIDDPCDPDTPETFDMVALIICEATLAFTNCPETALSTTAMYIGANFRNCGDGCCLHEMVADDIYVLDFVGVPQCRWKSVSGTIHFQKRAGLC